MDQPGRNSPSARTPPSARWKLRCRRWAKYGSAARSTASTHQQMRYACGISNPGVPPATDRALRALHPDRRVANGLALQLPIYLEATQKLHPERPISASYCFPLARGTVQRRRAVYRRRGRARRVSRQPDRYRRGGTPRYIPGNSGFAQRVARQLPLLRFPTALPRSPQVLLGSEGPERPRRSAVQLPGAAGLR